MDAKLVKKLRDMTGAGMMDCKKALVEADGDIDKAIDILREKGEAKAVKKADRITAEGLVNLVIAEDGKSASVIEVNSETDFVAKNKDFQDFVQEIANVVLEQKTDDMAAVNAATLGDMTVEDAVKEKVSTIGENISFRRAAYLEQPQGALVGYVHGGGKIATVVSLKSEASVEELATLGKDVAMQIASMNPKYISKDDVEQSYIEHEKEILLTQAKNENEEEIKAGKKGKPEHIIEKMVEGRLQKELKEVCLLEQPFVKDGDFTVAQVIANVAKELGKDIALETFVRYEVGEGLEKRTEDFAAEVAKQMGN